MVMLIAGLLLFLGAHFFVRWQSMRANIITKIGAHAYKGLFSLVNGVGLALIIFGFAAAKKSPVILYTPWSYGHVAAILLMPLAVTLLASAYLPGRIKATAVHPMLASVKIWALAHLLNNGALHEVLLFGGFFVWASIARVKLGKAERQRLPFSFNDGLAIFIGIAGTLLIIHGLHQYIAGVALPTPFI